MQSIITQLVIDRPNEECRVIPTYIRFYADGRFKLNRTKEYPRLEDINNINNGLVGYYKIEDGNVIKIQIYTEINAGSDQLEYGLIGDDKDIVFLDENPRTAFWDIGFSKKGIKRKMEKTS
jgi:hypothetical protein